MKILQILFILYCGVCFSQDTKTFNNSDLSTPLPMDPSIKTGTLENGLKYYLKKNVKPEAKAELRLVLDAGSILEDENQLGLAHFIEHMAFNGTKSFKKNELIDYLQSIGVQFGADLNAHTSFDETVYKLTVPTDDEGIFDTSLDILRDWADGITLSDDEIDKERGVVAEELRARNNANSRMYDKTISVITNNSRYSKRLPIGSLDIILNGEHSALKNFYKDWYRPDLMAVIIVGDIDIDKTEKKVKSLFSKIKEVKNPKERTRYTIEDNSATTIKVVTDKEAKSTSVSFYYKEEKEAVSTLEDYKNDIIKLLFTGMLKQRLDELELAENTPLLSATGGIGNFLSNKDAYYLKAILKEEQINDGISILLQENERIKQHGFKATELERYKKALINNAELFRKEAGKIPSKLYVEELIDNFTDNEPVLSENFRYEFYQHILPTISINDVNEIADFWIQNKNLTIILNAPEKENLKLPTENDILGLLETSTSKEIEPYVDTLGDVKLKAKIVDSGKVTASSYNEKIDVTTWELSNGVKIILKPTELQNDLISLRGYRQGGSSIAPDELYVSARQASNIIGNSGVDGISNINLEKLNMGRTVSVTPYINYYDELFSGSSTSEELERMLTLINLYFTAPNKDEKVFNTSKERMLASIKNDSLNPDTVFDNEISKTMTNNDLRSIPLSEKQINEELKLEESFNFYKERFSNANGFTFIFVGNFDINTLKPMVLKYLGGLPSDLKEQQSWRDIGLRRITGKHRKVITKGTEDKSKVDIRFTGKLDYNLDNQMQVSLLGKLLKIKLTEELREKMSGVYGVQVSGYATDRPYDWYRMNVRFTCDPENREALIDKVHEVIKDIQENGASEKNVAKIKEAELNITKVALKSNSYWVMKLRSADEYGWNPEEILDYEKRYDVITSDYFKKAANTYFDYSNHVEFILIPENLEE
ncbi:M16 family metallopeptidase [Joostella sp.]|uniref:M16 family metallopeptidase n=1 Tax=Joostella sp. TaxID=2231138 RepID=UPI003A90BF0F